MKLSTCFPKLRSIILATPKVYIYLFLFLKLAATPLKASKGTWMRVKLDSLELPKAWANKTDFVIMIAHFYIRRKLNIQYSLERVLIQRILIGFEAILE